MALWYLITFSAALVFLFISIQRKRAQRRQQLEILEQPEIVPINAEEFITNKSSSLADLGFDTIEDILPPPAPVEQKYIEPKTSAVTQVVQEQPTEVLVIHVMAPKTRPFLGYELVQALVSVDLRHGEMKIFHRHEQADGQGHVLFSVAQATEPGIFNLDDIGAIQCVGLSLFMHTNPNYPSLPTFDLMLETAQQLADDLEGDLQDMNHLPLTPQTIEYYRKKLSPFEKGGGSA